MRKGESESVVEVFKDQMDANLVYVDASERFLTKLENVDDPEQNLVLKPDNKVSLRDGKLHVTPVEDYNPYRWKEGLICFRNESFMSIMKDFEKYYGLAIHVKNKEVMKYVYTGKFRQTDGVDYALRVLQKDIKFTYHRDDENQIIYVE